MTLLAALFGVLGVTLALMGVNEHARGPHSRRRKALEIAFSGYVFLGIIMAAIAIVLLTSPRP